MKETFYHLQAPVSMTIALLADLHNRPFDGVIRSLDVHRPDMICIAGDLIYGYAPPDDGLVVVKNRQVLPFLSACQALAPTYVSLGNHDYLLCEDDLRLIRQTGVRVLDDDWIAVDGVVVGGLSSGRVARYRAFRTGMAERYPAFIYTLNGVPQKPRAMWINRFRRYAAPGPSTDWLDRYERQPGYHILLCHHPEYWEGSLLARPIELVLSGHAHGGQIRLFDRGLYAPGQGWLPKYTRGIHRGPFGVMAVSAGLSNTGGVPRLFNPREIVYIALSSDPQG